MLFSFLSCIPQMKYASIIFSLRHISIQHNVEVDEMKLFDGLLRAEHSMSVPTAQAFSFYSVFHLACRARLRNELRLPGSLATCRYSMLCSGICLSSAWPPKKETW